MGFSDVLWIFIILTSLQPVIKQRMLAAARTKAISKIEKEHGSRVILLVHRQESMALLGFPMVRYISIQVLEQVLRAIRLTDPKVPIRARILHTPGGLVLSQNRCRSLGRSSAKRKGDRVRAALRHAGGTYDRDGGGRDRNERAVLGPVDPQVGQYPARPSSERWRQSRCLMWTTDPDHGRPKP